MKRFHLSLIMACLLALALPLDLHAWPVPDTGQTKCYDDAGNEIDPCPQPGEPFYGQDGNFLIDPPSYTKLGENGVELDEDATEWIMVRDNVTGLIWEVKQKRDGVKDYGNPRDADNTYTWYDSDHLSNGGNAGTPGEGTDTKDFIGALNAGHFGGNDDWRLPTEEELRSIVNYGIPEPGPTIKSEYFPNTPPAYYWSSNTVVYSPGQAGLVYFGYGWDNNFFKSEEYYVRAVRGGQDGSFGHLVRNGDGTITDTSTGLMWELKTDHGGTLDKDNTYQSSQALSYCSQLTLAGNSDWRLPSIKELASIVDSGRYNPTINKGIFPNTVTSYYWTSSTNAGYPEYAWGIMFIQGDDFNNPKSYERYVRAVRGGQARLLGNLVISSPSRASAWNSGSTLPISWETAQISGNVAISISYEGGKPGTYQSIVTSTPNDGDYQWTVPDVSSFNCMLRIEPISDPSKGTTQGLFTIGNFILPAPSSLVFDEPASSTETPVGKTFAVTLTGDSSTDLELALASSNPSEFSVFPASVTLSSTNWNTGVQITVTPEYDGIPDGEQTSAVLVTTVDPYSPFHALDLPACNVTVRDSNATPTLFSVYPALGTATQPLDVTLKGIEFSSTTQVYLYPEGGTPVEITPVDFIDENTLAATLPAQPAGDYNLKAGNSELQNAVTFAAAPTLDAQARKHAILAAGSGPFYDNGLWLATEKCIRNAYQTLTIQGYGAEQIQLLTRAVGIDFTGDGQSDKDGDAGLASLQSAISGLTAGNADELLLFLVGPGADGRFQFGSDNAPEYLTPAILDGWLDDLQSRISGRVIVVIDACQSGAFLPGLRPPAGKKRIAVAGAAPWESAWFLDDGEISFSHRLFDHLFNNPGLLTAFDKAKAELSVFQTAQIDASGDGVPDLRRLREGDVENLGTRNRMVEVSPPEIGSLAANPPLLNTPFDYDSDLTASGVVIPAGLDRIWCRIVAPIEVLRNPANPVLYAPTVKLFETGAVGEFGNTYEEFLYDGDYRALAHAQDRAGVRNLVPQEAVVTQTQGIPLDIGPGDVNVDTYVDIADAIRALQAAAGKHPHAIKYADADGDGRIGVGDAVFILQKVGRMRE